MGREKVLWPFLLSATDGQLSPQTARRSNHSILKEINPKYSLERLMLKLQYFGHQMQRARLLEKTLMMGETKAKGGEMVR